MQSSKQQPFLISHFLCTDEPLDPKGGQGGDLRTPWNTYTEINNSVKIFFPLKNKIYFFILVFFANGNGTRA